MTCDGDRCTVTITHHQEDPNGGCEREVITSTANSAILVDQDDTLCDVLVTLVFRAIAKESRKPCTLRPILASDDEVNVVSFESGINSQFDGDFILREAGSVQFAATKISTTDVKWIEEGLITLDGAGVVFDNQGQPVGVGSIDAKLKVDFDSTNGALKADCTGHADVTDLDPEIETDNGQISITKEAI